MVQIPLKGGEISIVWQFSKIVLKNIRPPPKGQGRTDNNFLFSVWFFILFFKNDLGVWLKIQKW